MTTIINEMQHLFTIFFFSNMHHVMFFWMCHSCCWTLPRNCLSASTATAAIEKGLEPLSVKVLDSCTWISKTGSSARWPKELFHSSLFPSFDVLLGCPLSFFDQSLFFLLGNWCKVFLWGFHWREFVDFTVTDRTFTVSGTVFEETAVVVINAIIVQSGPFRVCGFGGVGRGVGWIIMGVRDWCGCHSWLLGSLVVWTRWFEMKALVACIVSVRHCSLKIKWCWQCRQSLTVSFETVVETLLKVMG